MDLAERFDALVGDLEYPMFIVTARAGRALGCLVGFTTQASIDPPRSIVCLSHRNRTFRRGHNAPAARRPRRPRDAGDLAELFGGGTGRRATSSPLAWHEGPRAFRSSTRCENWFAGRVVAPDAGDHDAFLLEPRRRGGRRRGRVHFHRAKRIDPGHEA